MTDATEAAVAFWRDHRPETALYERSGGDDYRGWALDAVRSFEPETVLELGCHAGVLLEQLSALEGVVAIGVDVNADAVREAKNAGLIARVGALPDALIDARDRSVDVIVSSYCLSYLSPYDLVLGLAHAIRIANKGIVIVEPMAGAGVETAIQFSNSGLPEWRHDFFDALESAARYVPDAVVKMTRTRKGPSSSGVNGVVTAEVQWRPRTI